MNKKKVVFLTSLMLQFLFLLQSTTNINYISQSDKQSSNYEGTLIDSSYQQFQRFNPVISDDSINSKIESLIFQSLVTHDRDMNIILELANNLVISDNKLDYTFHLREDVFWHDGEKFTADDVIFTLNRLLDPEATISRKHLFDKLRYSDPFIPPYKMEDNYTVVLNLVSSFPPMMSTIMFPIIPEHVYLNHLGVDGINHTLDDCRDAEGVYTFNDDPKNLEPIGTGPMMFSEWNLGRNITLIRNSVTNGGPGYWNEHDAYLDK